MGPHKYFPYYYPNWTLTNISHIITKIGPHNYIISIKGRTYLSLAKPKKPSKFITMLVTTHRTLQSPLLHVTFYKAHYYMTPITQHLLQNPLLLGTYYKTHCYMTPITKYVTLQSLLLHNTHYKVRCYTTSFTKPSAIWYHITSQEKHLAIFIKA